VKVRQALQRGLPVSQVLFGDLRYVWETGRMSLYLTVGEDANPASDFSAPGYFQQIA